MSENIHPPHDTQPQVWEAHADPYIAFTESERFWYERYVNAGSLLEMIERNDALPRHVGSVAFDLGCGPGAFSRELIRRGSPLVMGCDISERLVQYAQETTAKEFGPPTSSRDYYFYQWDGFGRVWPVDRYDLTVCKLVLNYVQDMDELAANITQIAKPDGYLAVSAVHPQRSMLRRPEQSYFEVAPYEEVIGSESGTGASSQLSATMYHRSVEEYAKPFMSGGWAMVDMEEPEIPMEEAQRRGLDYTTQTPKRLNMLFKLIKKRRTERSALSLVLPPESEPGMIGTR